MKAEEFIKVWNGSNTVAEVMEKTGLNYRQATMRAYWLRLDHDVKKMYPSSEYYSKIGKTGGSRRRKMV